MREYNRYLFKLKFLKGTKVNDEEFDDKNIPENIIYNGITGSYIKVESKDTTKEDLDLFLKVKNTYNFNIIKNCVATCSVFFVLAVLCYIVPFIF